MKIIYNEVLSDSETNVELISTDNGWEKVSELLAYLVTRYGR